MQHRDVANLNKFSFVPEANLHLQSSPEYFNCYDASTFSTFPTEFYEFVQKNSSLFKSITQYSQKRDLVLSPCYTACLDTS